MRGRGLLTTLALAVPARASAQAGPPPPSYTAALPGCAAFLERVRTEVRAQQGGAPYEERGERTGVFVIRFGAGAGGRPFEAWYDSLAVWYDARAGRLVPDTDGLVGGRWHGTVGPTGGVILTVRPFQPPELRAVTDLSDAPLDFLPPLPTVALAPGGSWSDSLGLTIERLSDSAAGVVERYRWQITSRTEPPMEQDSTLRLRQEADDKGQFSWSRRDGPRGWSRTVVITTDVGGRTAGAYRGRVEQRIDVRRVTDPPQCR